MSVVDVSRWSDNERIKDQESATTPGTAILGQRLYIVYLGKSSGDIWQSYYDIKQKTWTVNTNTNASKGYSPPSLVEFKDKLHMIFRGEGDKLFHYISDSTPEQHSKNWSVQNAISVSPSLSGPALASVGESIHLVFRSEEDKMYHYIYTKIENNASFTWISNGEIEGQKTHAQPLLVNYKNTPHLFYKGRYSKDIFWSRYENEKWTRGDKLAKVKSDATPGGASFEEKLHLIFRGKTKKDLWHCVYDGSKWSDTYQIIDQKTDSGPAVYASQDAIYRVHKGEVSKQLWYSIFI